MPSSRTLALWLVICFPLIRLSAQSSQEPMTGEYYLTGVREVGSGIKLNADSTFEFFFAYGALDRFGKGSWKQRDKQIILTSRPRPPKDFALVTSRKTPDKGITIRIVDPNKQLLRYVECTIRNGTEVRREMANADGEVHFASLPAEAISLRFELCPDRYSVFTIDSKAHNYFEFRFEPWIVEVFFENIPYTISGKDMEGPHPLLEPGKTYSFVHN
jgi:hypothetical protein